MVHTWDPCDENSLNTVREIDSTSHIACDPEPNQAHVNKDYLHIGYYDERSKKHYNTSAPKYTACCRGGQVQIRQLQQALKVLYDLLYGNGVKSKHFHETIRAYDSMFQFTSMGTKIDHKINCSWGPPTFILCGKNYHLMGITLYHQKTTMLNSHSSMSGEEKNNIHKDIIKDLKDMLYEDNVLIKAFRMVMESMAADSTCNRDGRRYNLPTTNEVVALMVGDFDIDRTDCDIVVEIKEGRLQCINQFNPVYLGL
ncbi:hypothetical protein Ahy_A05g024448 [Arachis hypogaea]|uniref:Helitron helicase-like domain-containing protein n=1 Tax=Arachis hypogaea TaxID=3818 RepID=A0A445D5U8_ARAHY|nr:hypothetical protein Ahy_A05g024448 [Arachis hypogaea]